MNNEISYTEAVNKALIEVMSIKPECVCMGLGINDPKRIFGTTTNLLEMFGKDRVIEPPTSENALTGIALGLAIKGFSVCLTHQRLDFSLLSLDQIINSISKWAFMFDSDADTPLLIRLIVGRGWGQGPTHSQSFHSFLSSIPGLDVYYPTTPKSAYKTIKRTLTKGNPSIMIEHRWLHNSKEIDNDFSSEDYSIIGNMRCINEGSDFTIFTYGYMVAEARKAVTYLKKYNLNVELISTEKLNDIKVDLLINSIQKTKKILLIEPFYIECSLTSSICTSILKSKFLSNLNLNYIDIIALPFENESTSYFDTKHRYVSWIMIVKKICHVLNKEIPIDITPSKNHDVPGDWFKGPF